MQKEIEKLPETLEALDPKERINVVCNGVVPVIKAVATRTLDAI